LSALKKQKRGRVPTNYLLQRGNSFFKMLTQLSLSFFAGNHDDPAGGENLSAIDVLAACNLVNYFGKHVS
jgi:DNA repair exonuclease SbcCD nuclease subunit